MSLDINTLPKVVAIVGSREFPHAHWVQKLVRRLNPGTIVVSGGARGVDTFAENEVVRRRVEHKDIFFKPFRVEDFEWTELGKSVGFTRNELLIRWVKKYKGHVIIFALQQDIDAEKGGSWDDVKQCKALDVPYTLFTV